jgi:hypothetical protein
MLIAGGLVIAAAALIGYGAWPGSPAGTGPAGTPLRRPAVSSRPAAAPHEWLGDTSPHEFRVDRLALSPDGGRALVAFWVRGATADPKGQFSLLAAYDTTSGRRLWRRWTERRVGSVHFLPGSEALVSEEGRPVALWDAVEGKAVRELRGGAGGTAVVLDVTPDGRLALVTGDFGVGVADVSTGRMRRWLDLPSGLVNYGGLSPDGSRVLTNFAAYQNWRPLTLWDASTGHEIRTYGDAEHRVSGGKFSPDGRKALVGVKELHQGPAGGYVGLMDVATGQVEWRMQWSIDADRFTPDGTQLVATVYEPQKPTEERFLGRWESATGRELWRVGLRGGESRGAFSADARRFLVPFGDMALYDGRGGYPRLRLWDSAAGRLLREWGAKDEMEEGWDELMRRVPGRRPKTGRPPCHGFAGWRERIEVAGRGSQRAGYGGNLRGHGHGCGQARRGPE